MTAQSQPTIYSSTQCRCGHERGHHILTICWRDRTVNATRCDRAGCGCQAFAAPAPAADTATEQAVLARVEADLTSGRYFLLHAISARSTLPGADWVVLHRSAYAHAVATLGRMAAASDPLCQVASQILPHVPPYQTRHELVARVYEEAAAALAKSYADVVGRAGPEGGNRDRAYTLAERITLAYWLAEATAPCSSSVPGVGWAVAALREREAVYVPAMPSLH